MADATQILSQIKQGDPSAVEQLLPLVNAELRKLPGLLMWPSATHLRYRCGWLQVLLAQNSPSAAHPP